MRASPSFCGSQRAAFLAGAVVVLAGAAAYANSFASPFVYLDVPAILDNPTIRHLSALGRVLSPPVDGGVTVGGRPIVNLSLALNYAISGTRVWSYHALNLLIHLLAGLTLFGLARRTRKRDDALRPAGFALALALLWTLHPLQTESVTYVVQRAESLMGLLYLLTLYCFVRGAERQAEARRAALPWFGLSALACLCGMGTKEVMVSAPVIVLLYDRTWLAGSFAQAWRRRWGVHGALAATWIPLAWLVHGTGGSRGGTSGWGLGISWWTYARTQFPAIVHYLRLSVWPHPLVFYYAVQWDLPSVRVGLDAMLVAALAVAALWALFGPGGRGRRLGFLGAWFFAILAPTSLVPGLSQTIAEHRMYLALAPVLAIVVIATEAWLGRASLWALLALAAGFGGLTARRNEAYRSELTLWGDTVAKAPANPYSENNLGLALAAANRLPEAIDHFNRALVLDPRYPEAHNNLGLALAGVGRAAEATAHYEQALRLKPAYPEADTNLGVTLANQGQWDAAVVHFNRALALMPDYFAARNDLAVTLASTGRLAEAIEQYRRVLALAPENAGTHANLGNALAHHGDLLGAIAEYEEALNLSADNPEVESNLGAVLASSHRFADAIVHYDRALALAPNDPDIHYNLALALQAVGRPSEAAAQLAAAERLRQP
jgi:tetratricopeptide (TPR) repeat protein